MFDKGTFVKGIFIIFRSKKSYGTGALLDDRTTERKEKDYSVHEAYASANAVVWVEKPEKEWRAFSVRDQGLSNSCVANTIAKINEVLYWLKEKTNVRFSSAHVYARRSNKPKAGMVGIDAFDIAMTGVTLDELVPSDRKNDAEIDGLTIQSYHREVGEVFKINGHVGVPIRDIDRVASVIQTTGKAVMVWFYFTSDEWARSVPEIMVPLASEYDGRALRHSVTAVDFTLYKGKKALVIEDSAHFGGLSRRVVTEDFFRVRNFFARYPMNFRFGGLVDTDDGGDVLKPLYTFKATLEFIPLDGNGNISLPDKHERQLKDVKALQDILKYEGLFPVNIESTGYYGSITAKHVLAFQLRHSVDGETVLTSLGGRTVGPKTIAALNKLYSI